MTITLVRGQRIEIRGFGRFRINHRPARNGRNPKTGVKVAVSEKFVPHFKAARELRERINR
jgi:integration host factor subunit beta